MAEIDIGTTGNWISSHVVKHLQLPIEKVTRKRDVAFIGERLESAEMIIDLLWCRDGGLGSRQSDFRITYGAPFDILFGYELLFSRPPYFDERALILTQREETEGSLEHLLAGTILKSNQS